jgi:hypothetical protein
MLNRVNNAMDIAMHVGETRVLIPVADGPRFSGHPPTDVSKWGEHGALGRWGALAVHDIRAGPSGSRVIRDGAGSAPKTAAE